MKALFAHVRIDSSKMKTLKNVFSSKFANHIVRIPSVYAQIKNVFQDTASTPDVRYAMNPS